MVLICMTVNLFLFAEVVIYLGKALIQSSADGWGWALSLVVFWPEATQPLGLVVVVVQSLSHVQIFETPLTAAGRTSPVFDHFPELAQTPVH